jgi:hypothetical protein
MNAECEHTDRESAGGLEIASAAWASDLYHSHAVRTAEFCPLNASEQLRMVFKTTEPKCIRQWFRVLTATDTELSRPWRAALQVLHPSAMPPAQSSLCSQQLAIRVRSAYNLAASESLICDDRNSFEILLKIHH